MRSRSSSRPLLSPLLTRRQGLVLLGLGAGAPLLPRIAWSAEAPSIDPRVELLAMVFRLAGNPEYTDCRLPGYAESADTWFLPVRDHAAVVRARKLRREHGVGYDAVISLAAHLRPDFSLRVKLEPDPTSLDARWPRDQVVAFVGELQAFATAGKAAGFLASKADTHARIESGVSGLVARVDGTWHERFFGARPRATYRVIASPLAGPSNYGAMVRGDGPEEIVSVLGVWEFDHTGAPTFGPASLATFVHETAHSFVNPLVRAHEAEFAIAMERIFPWVADRMRGMAYATWQVVLSESLARASVVRYLAAQDDDLAVEEEVEQQISKGFLWTEQLAETLAEYEGDRARWPDLDAFVPELVAFFESYGRTFDRKQRALEATRPRVVRTTPPDGGSGVDPATTTLTVTFDRPMKDGSWSVVGTPQELPRMGTLAYDEGRTTLTIPVTLEAGRTYTISLNSERFTGFKTADGTPLAPHRWTFSTR